MPYIAKKDLIEAWRLWIVDARLDPESYEGDESLSHYSAEELAEREADHLLSLLDDVKLARV